MTEVPVLAYFSDQPGIGEIGAGRDCQDGGTVALINSKAPASF